MKKQAFNPYLPSYEYVPDGEPHVFGDRVYVFGSHDRFDGAEYCMNDYVAWSAPVDDLSDWRYDGVIYRKECDPINDGNHPNQSKTCENGIHYMYAPDVCRGVDGKYYLYYCLGDLRRISVARCDEPAGEYEFYGYVHDKNGQILGEREGDMLQGDPGVLVDDDGRIYLYSGNAALNGFMKRHIYTSNHSMVEELEQDMLTVKQGPLNFIPDISESKDTPGGFAGHELFEASSIRKIGDTYYFVYSDIHCTNLCYATSKNPMTGFKYRGVIISNGDVGLGGRTQKTPVTAIGNNHGSIEKIGDKYYVFYHRQTNYHDHSRQGCAEEIVLEPDGSIRQVEITSCGLNGDALVGEGKYSAHLACALWNKKKHNHFFLFATPGKSSYPYITQDIPDVDAGMSDPPADCQYITNIRNGFACGFKYFEIHSLHEISVEVRGNASGKIEIFTDEHLKNKISEIEIVPETNWKWFCSKKIHAEDGRKPLYFRFNGKGMIEFNTFKLN